MKPKFDKLEASLDEIMAATRDLSEIIFYAKLPDGEFDKAHDDLRLINTEARRLQRNASIYRKELGELKAAIKKAL